MLVLSRQKNQRIIIDDCIEIVVVDIKGDMVRLGIEAPSDIPVHREEVWRAIRMKEGDQKK
jgi:carbon storage regulator